MPVIANIPWEIEEYPDRLEIWPQRGTSPMWRVATIELGVTETEKEWAWQNARRIIAAVNGGARG